MENIFFSQDEPQQSKSHWNPHHLITSTYLDICMLDDDGRLKLKDVEHFLLAVKNAMTRFCEIRFRNEMK